jgi:hypothetical protein
MTSPLSVQAQHYRPVRLPGGSVPAVGQFASTANGPPRLCDDLLISEFAFGDALKGGIHVGSRVRIAAATCLVASGLCVGGIGGALAFAKPPPDSHKVEDHRAGSHPGGDAGAGNPNQGKPRDERPDGEKPDNGKPDDHRPDGEKPDDHKPGDGGVDDGERDDGGVDDGERDDSEGEDGGSTPTTPEQPPTTDVPPPTKDPDPGECNDNGEDSCGSGFPWWPFPWPWPPGPGEPPGPGGGGGGGGGEPPAGRPGVPSMQLPAELRPETEPASPIDATPGVGVASALGLEPITLPVVVAPPPLLGGGPGPAPAEQLPGSARGTQAQPPAGRQPSAADIGSNVIVPPASYRVGYTDYLRSAGISQVVAVAASGVAGILVLTGAGGLVGYRQAKAGLAVRTTGTARFMN